MKRRENVEEKGHEEKMKSENEMKSAAKAKSENQNEK
jgi:hypothetical protein